MKNRLMALAVLSGFILTGCAAGYVAARPADVVYARSVSPGPGYVWVSGEWRWSNGHYHWREGSWQRAREGRKWKSGYWEHNQKGYKWQSGYWE
jgi:WXXGXW repeat (2 copies)